MTERNKVIWPEPFYESESRATAESDHCCFPLLPARIRTVVCAQDMSDFIRTAILTFRSKKTNKKGKTGLLSQWMLEVWYEQLWLYCYPDIIPCLAYKPITPNKIRPPLSSGVCGWGPQVGSSTVGHCLLIHTLLQFVIICVICELWFECFVICNL